MRKEREEEGSGRDRFRCPHCGGARAIWDHARGEMICAKCGFVVREHVSVSEPYWRSGEEEDRRRHSGPPLSETLYDRGLSSRVGWENRDSNGRELSAEQRAKFARLRRWDERYRHAENAARTFSRGARELSRVCANLALSRAVRGEASLLFRKALNLKLVRGRSAQALSAAAVLAACKRHGVRRELREIARESGVSERELNRAYRLLIKKLQVRTEPPSPKDFAEQILKRVCPALDLRERTMGILGEGRFRGNPSKVAAAAVYRAASELGYGLTQAQIARAARLSRATLLKLMRNSG